MRGAASALALATLVLGACSGGEPAIEQGELPGLVLQPSDLAPDYRRFDEGRLVRADSPRGTAGWKARYRWTGGADAAVPLVVESRVDLHESSGDADEALDGVRGELDWEALPTPDLGDEALAATSVRPGTPSDVRFYVAAWRDRNVSASLTLNGFDGNVSVDSLLALARKQASRIADAR